MASNYGPNVGFRRSTAELVSGNEGRQKVPAAGDFKQMDLVTFDEAAPGFIKHAADGDVLEPGYTGLLIQEHDFLKDPADGVVTGAARNKVKNNERCSIWTGGGLKVWFKNTTDRTVFAGSLNVGDYVKWNGTAYAAGSSATDSIGRVTAAGTDYAEVVLFA